MENWDDYRLILALHRGKSLRHAAAQLAVNHTTVSRRLVALDNKFGAPVAEATPKGFQLTPLGEALLGVALEMEALVKHNQRIERAMQLDLSGAIRVSVPPALLQYALLDELCAFQQLHPGIALNISSNYQAVDLDDCEADVVVRVSNTPSEHLVGHRLFPITVNYYANPRYLAETPPDKRRWIVDPNTGDPAQWIQHSPFPDVPVGLTIDDLVLRHQAAANGFGLIRGAHYIATQFAELTVVGDQPNAPLMDIWVLTHPDYRDVARIKTLMAYLTDCLRSKKSQFGESD
ncbi:LysR family transcriptional regulator [Aestuariibacter halophilus]|uniref:LysR family transcriptional regulator n=1 Tax=Fluctibacter halophilus TaxID=226011 RepID=A0ABS8G7L9_9ALTE|nr:LysR family transcriptional regulator [Aestuariibacter halophilus]MCC2616523.1 LysR family transcriptional regulator [Aestuariibacter halophilus]